MDKETLSNYGWIVIAVLVLAVMLALATPFGTFVAGAIKSTTAGLFDVNQAALGSAGINVDDLVFENCDHLETEVRNVSDTYTGDTVCLECGKVLSAGKKIIFAHNGATVPEGGKYTATDGTLYKPGDAFPETVTTGDKYEYGDYEYRYNYHTNSGYTWTENIAQNGWGVRYRYTGNFGPILESINGETITSLRYTFYQCTNLTVAPAIPSGVTDISYTFYRCTSLVTAPEIPNNVTYMSYTFFNCKKFTDKDMPIIPDSVLSMEGTFWGCTALTDLSNFIIPDSVTNIAYIFYNCTSVVAAPEIPTSVTCADYAFFVTNITGSISVPCASTTTCAVPNGVTIEKYHHDGCGH